MKKIRGKVHYFGAWAKVVNGKLTRIDGDGWEQALALYKAQAGDLHAGRTNRLCYACECQLLWGFLYSSHFSRFPLYRREYEANTTRWPICTNLST
jgi:hypothetical protein